MKRFIGLILVLCLVMTGAALAENTALKRDIVVLYTSDVHCGIDQGFGYAGLAAIRDNLEKNCHVLLVDNGDAVQGEAIGTLTKGEEIIKLMNAVGYDAAIPGNHEFDYGMPRFLELTGMAEYPYLSANFNREGELVFAPYEIFEFDGVKLAVVGLTTPKTISSSAPKYFQNEAGEYIYGFMQDETGEAFYAAAQSAVDSARGEGADYVVVMGHLGNEANCSPWTYTELIANTTGIDAVLDGHSHDVDQVEMQNKDGGIVLRSASGTKLQNVGFLRIAADGTLSAGLYSWPNETPLPELIGLENSVTIAIENAAKELDAKLDEVVGHTDVALTINDPVARMEDGSPLRIVRCAETNLGDFCADAYLAMSGAEIAFINGGGVRDTIEAGDITMADLLAVHPFGNMMCVVEASGSQILDALEMAVDAIPDSKGGFLQVAGLSFEIHSYLPSSVQTDVNGMFTGVAGEYRVKNVRVGGEPLEPERMYSVASIDYILKSQGGGMTMFDGCKILQDDVMLDNQVLINYITDTLGGVVGEMYEDPYGAGRIVFVETAPEK